MDREKKRSVYIGKETVSTPKGDSEMTEQQQKENPYGISTTKRLVVPAAESLLFQKEFIAGEGHITLVDYMGGDAMVERVATAGHGRSVFSRHLDLHDFFSYLRFKRIDQPFKSAQLKFQIQAPLAVALHLVYEAAASTNEYSGRYSIMIESSFLPTAEYLAARMHGLDHQKAIEHAKQAQELIADVRKQNYAAYAQLVSQGIDLTRELARIPLELNNDTKFFWKIDLYALVDLMKKKKALRARRDDDLIVTYIDLLKEAAYAVAPEATQALFTSGKPLTLTMPRDEEVIDSTPLPPSWKPQQTRRSTTPELEALLFERIPYHDHGAVQAVDYMGDDNSPVESARVSYGAGTRRVLEDKHLIRYLIRHRHTTPSEHAELAVEGKVPVFVDPRQAGRHRTLDHHCFMGETLLGSEVFLPSSDQLRYQDRKNRQGRGDELDEELKPAVMQSLQESFARQKTLIETLRSYHVAEEDIRNVKGVGYYTFNWRTGDLHNWMHFLGLRLEGHTQKETHDLARIYAKFLTALAPTTMQALQDYHINAIPFTALELPLLAQALNLTPEQVENLDTYRSVGLTMKTKDGREQLNREGVELQQKLRKLLEKRKQP